MELRQLKYFCKTAELLSFSEAAKALFITQSTLSQQIKQLEGELDAQLFRRNNHGVALTEIGMELLPYAKATLNKADSCIEHIRDVQNLMTGTLNIGVTYTFSPTLNETLLEFMKRYPNVKLNIYNKTMEELMTMLEKHDVDIVLSFKPTQTYDRIESHILFDNHLDVVVNKKHELASCRSIDLARLQQYEIALPGKGLQARNQFDIIVASKGYKFNCPIELNEVNILLKNLEERGNVISDNQIRSLMLGEAYALRAYCQFDILRLFGQIPQGGAKQVSLPYSETTSIYEMPSYYDFNGYVEKLMSDLDNAENYLKDNDPIFTYTFDQLNNVGTSEGIYMEDDYLAFRQFRMNYWAVRGLRARIYQYIGDTRMAYQTAKEIIDAKGADGKPLLTLSTKSDVDQGYYASPSEALFLLHAPKLIDYSIEEIGGDPSVQIRENEQLHITGTMLTQQLYAGQNTMSDVRYNQVWERNTANNGGAKYPTIKKYFYNTELNSTTIEEVYQALLTKRQVIPLMRLSEMYLIAIETTTDLAEANALYKSFMEARSVSLTEDAFASLADVKALVLDEYRREFYGEGVMFYTYKRIGADEMLWRSTPVDEDDYILPLPLTEYNPNNLQN